MFKLRRIRGGGMMPPFSPFKRIFGSLSGTPPCADTRHRTTSAHPYEVRSHDGSRATHDGFLLKWIAEGPRPSGVFSEPKQITSIFVRTDHHNPEEVVSLKVFLCMGTEKGTHHPHASFALYHGGFLQIPIIFKQSKKFFFYCHFLRIRISHRFLEISTPLPIFFLDRVYRHCTALFACRHRG